MFLRGRGRRFQILKKNENEHKFQEEEERISK